jgi:hypothetical protein
VFLWLHFGPNAATGGCAGAAALAYNAAFNLCLLLLFVQFYLSTYRKRSVPKKKAL